MALLSQHCTEIAPIAVGQVDFKDQGVETPAFDGDDRLGLVQSPGREDGEPMLVREAIRQGLPNSCVVVHDQDGSPGRHGALLDEALDEFGDAPSRSAITVAAFNGMA